jgi:hypothetical protein
LLNHAHHPAGTANGIATDLALERVRSLMRLGRFQDATRELHEVVRLAPERRDPFVLRAECFLAMGHLEEAERDYRWARRVDPDDEHVEAQIAAISRQREMQKQVCRARRSLHGFTVIRHLGSGWEGAVYQCADIHGKQYVVKQFHPHRIDKINDVIHWHRRPIPSFRTQIIELGQALQTAPHPLFYGYSGLVRQGRLEALYYPYRRLYEIGRDALGNASLRLALVRAVLSGQAHLIDRTGRLMSDLRVGQFMLDALGRIRYVDYGASVLPLTDFRIEEDRLHVQTLIWFLVEVFAWDEWRAFTDPRAVHESPDSLQRRVDRSPGLQACLRTLPALHPFLGAGAILDGDNFIEPGVYRRAAAAIPVRWPIEVLSRSAGWALRRRVRRLRRSLRQQQIRC